MFSFSSMELSFGPQLLLFWGSLSSLPWCHFALSWKKQSCNIEYTIATSFSSGTECVCLCGGRWWRRQWRGGFNLINAPLDESAASRLYPSITWLLSLRPALQSGCPASSAPPPGLRSGASAERCRSLPQTRHWSTPEGSWASWRSLWLLWKADGVNTTSQVLKLGVAVWLHASLAFFKENLSGGAFFYPLKL